MYVWVAAFCWLFLGRLQATEPDDVWPTFRGTGDSRTAANDLPLEWSDGENVAWNLDLPGYGQSSPVVWKESIFLTAVEGEFKEKLHLLSVGLSSGEVRWQKTWPSSRREKNTNYVSKAAPTPAVDANRVYAFFESTDLVALDHSGGVLRTGTALTRVGKSDNKKRL